MVVTIVRGTVDGVNRVVINNGVILLIIKTGDSEIDKVKGHNPKEVNENDTLMVAMIDGLMRDRMKDSRTLSIGHKAVTPVTKHMMNGLDFRFIVQLLKHKKLLSTK